MRAIARIAIKSGGEGLLLLRPGRYTIGRGSECDLIVNNRATSRLHAVIEVERKSAKLVDQGSRNGTKVNGVQTESCVLEHGTVIQFGSASCVFEWLGPGAFDDDDPTPSLPNSDPHENSLTPGEHRVLVLLLGGLAEKAIAVRLSLSRHTVHNHVKRIYSAYRVNSRSELLANFIVQPEHH